MLWSLNKSFIVANSGIAARLAKYLAIAAGALSATGFAAALGTTTGRALIRITLRYLRALLWFYRNGPDAYDKAPFFRDNLHSKIHIYSLALVFHLWHKPHYRNGTFQQDMAKNLRNVALPGTGLALSAFSSSKVAYAFFLVCLYPLVSLLGALDARRKTGAEVVSTFEKNLLCPEDWFSLWRLNCRMATFHSSRTQNKGYKMEDKWTFLTAAERCGVPVSPSLRVPKIVCKHRNEEGGLGYKSFSNAAHGGDWIIQEHLTNSKGKLGAVLPKNAPLSTFRVITAATPLDAAGSAYQTRALSCVFRAGRAGAATDHVCILFNVNRETGEVTHGTTNQHWYQLGVARAATCPWGVYRHEITHHPDSGQAVVGHSFQADIKKILSVSENAHKTLAPGVPIIGWDVAVTENHGILLLEGNFSCNFFCADFDMNEYLHMLDAHIRNLTLSEPSAHVDKVEVGVASGSKVEVGVASGSKVEVGVASGSKIEVGVAPAPPVGGVATKVMDSDEEHKGSDYELVDKNSDVLDANVYLNVVVK